MELSTLRCIGWIGFLSSSAALHVTESAFDDIQPFRAQSFAFLLSLFVQAQVLDAVNLPSWGKLPAQHLFQAPCSTSSLIVL